MNITALAGGVGGAKLIVGLAEAAGARDLTAVVNTADDAVIYGVHVSPDVDIVTYWLAGLADEDRGWGIENDSFNAVEALGALGHEAWFRLGDRDLATCLYRTQRLGDGASLTEATDEIRRALGVETRILPMSDDPVRTKVVTGDGRTLDFQEYFVKERCEPEVAEVMFAGIDDAKPGPNVMDAITGSDVVVVCPSNPLVSIGPIVGLAGVRDALRAHPSVVAVTPIVRGSALKGPADRMLSSTGAHASAAGVARIYADFCTTFVVDTVDEPEADALRAEGVDARALDTIMRDRSASARLAESILTL